MKSRTQSRSHGEGSQTRQEHMKSRTIWTPRLFTLKTPLSKMLQRYRVDGDEVSGKHIIVFRWPQMEDHLPLLAFPIVFVTCALVLDH